MEKAYPGRIGFFQKAGKMKNAIRIEILSSLLLLPGKEPPT